MRHAILALLLCPASLVLGETPPRSHPPLRPLPKPSARPPASGTVRFADARNGNDAGDGSREKPWKTLAHAFKHLRPGTTLYLRGGVYHGKHVVSLAGEPGKPVTIAGQPGELAVLDGGLAEFLGAPASAWEPVKDGAPLEFRSTKVYPALAGGRRGVCVLGNFADSLVPLHGYRFVRDFRSDNPYWTLKNKLDDTTGIYCGPGLWLDPDSKRVHVRLAPTRLKFLGQNNYTGESDPRKLPLVVAGSGAALRVEKTSHVRIHDLVIRGSASATLEISQCKCLELDGVTVLGGSPAVSIRTTQGLTLTNSVVRGLTAPWSSRASHKYRGNSAYLVTVASEAPGCRDFEFARCEFTDNHDGLILGTASQVRFHHNLVDRFDDDGIYLTLQRPRVPEGILVFQNRFSRCLTTFAFAQSGKGVKNAVGPGVYIFRNVFDLRRGTPSTPPADEKEDAGLPACWNRACRIGGDHGSPVWEPMFFYHNTVLTSGPPWRGLYAAELGGHVQGSKRRVFNNLFVQASGEPGQTFPAAADDFAADANLLWSVADGPKYRGDPLAKFRASPAFAASKKRYPPGWGVADRFADPRFVSLPASPAKPADLRLRKDSPAVDAGVVLPAEWPDPLRKADRGKPDLGAVPLGEPLPPVGPRE